MSWNNFSEMQPREHKRYLVYHWYMDCIDILYWDGKKWEFNHKITHWMELPERPNDATSTALQMGLAIAK